MSFGDRRTRSKSAEHATAKKKQRVSETVNAEIQPFELPAEAYESPRSSEELASESGEQEHQQIDES